MRVSGTPRRSCARDPGGAVTRRPGPATLPADMGPR
jgi:hypothetical protein